MAAVTEKRRQIQKEATEWTVKEENI